MNQLGKKHGAESQWPATTEDLTVVSSGSKEESSKKGKAEKVLKKIMAGLPWWCSGQESACQRRGHRVGPWSGETPHAAGQLKPVHHNHCALTPEPAGRNYRACMLQLQTPACSSAHTPQLQSLRSRAATRETTAMRGAHAPRWRVAPTCHN